MTHKEAILQHLKKHKHITSWEAIELYGCTRLSHQIYLLRNKRYLIRNEQVHDINRFGNKVTFTKYILEE